MSSLPYNKRPYDVFISYSHENSELVNEVAVWLEKIAGLKVWWDRNFLKASDRLTSALPLALSNSRAALFFVSQSWIKSTWCEDEYGAAMQERRKDKRYSVIALQLDECQIPTFLANGLFLELNAFQPEVAVRILEALISEPAPWAHGERDVYMSRSWREEESKVADIVCGSLTQNFGFRLIGDSPDYADFGGKRVKRIIGSCGALVAILPFRDDPVNNFTSKWMVEEIELASELGRPYLLFHAEGVQLDAVLLGKAIGGKAFPFPQSPSDKVFNEALFMLEEEYNASTEIAFSFYATSLKFTPQETDRHIRLIEKVTNMQCLLGQGLQGSQAQQAQIEIINRIRNSEFVLAEITSNPLNTLIEAGIALGAGTRLHLICKIPENGDTKTRFMFSNSEIYWYSNEIERIGYIHRVARMYRRRVFGSFST